MRWLWMLLLVSSLAIAGSATSRPEAQPSSSPVASCSAASCHGGMDVGKIGSEVTTWRSADPHSKAYSVLFNPDSQRIIANLRKGDSNRWRDAAHLEQACLNCHSTGAHSTFDGQPIDASSDGVGCDGCHGPSEKWLPKHYEPTWKGLTFQQKRDLGFNDTKDLGSRTLICASCHVGDKDRDVNHDLIAAGHPRLAFDYSRFHYQPGYTKHWTETQPERDFEIRSWFIGQVAALRAAANLTVERTSHGVVPELTEQSCFACHQSLTTPIRGTPGETPQWQPWHVTLLSTLIEESPKLFPGATAPKLVQFPVKQLGKALSNDERRRHAEALTADLDRWLDDLRKADSSQPIPADVLRQLAANLAIAGSKAPSDYDCLAPYYLALAALHHADEKTLGGISNSLESIAKQLKYKKGQTGPGEFDAETVKAAFAAIAKLLASP